MPMVAEDPTHPHSAQDADDDRSVVVPISARHGDDPRGAESDTARRAFLEDDNDPLPWPRRARKVQRISQMLAFTIPVCWMIAWPIGSMLANEQVTGVWALKFGYSLDVVLWAATAGICIRLIGYVLSLALRLEASAQQLVSGHSGRSFADLTPGSVSALNDEIDQALSRLAEAESLIRQQVRAIGNAGEALGAGTARSAARLEQERNALIALTEEMNREADRFAEKIAERSQAAADEHAGLEDRLADRGREFDSQINRFESVSAQSLDRFEELARAMEERSAALRNASEEATEHQTSLTNRLEENAARIHAAQEELANQSAKLETLMRDQRRRADRLAQVVTEQASRVVAPRQKPVTPPSPQAAAPTPTPPPAPVEPEPMALKDRPKEKHRWKDILAKVEEANPAPLVKPIKQAEEDIPIPPTPPAPKPTAFPREPIMRATQGLVTPKIDPAPAPSAPVRPAEPAPAPKPAPEKPSMEASPAPNMDVLDRLVVRIQNYSLVLQTQLFGGPSHEDLDRFEAGERQIFAKALIARDQDTLRARIQAELNQNAVFRERTNEFLRDFDTILEPLSAEAGGADAIQTYLTSPLGRLYMLTGSAAGHFD
ncbi:hypothetical protein [Parvularcula marina]|nr:hypothetical protein [Parvularcula marina]